MLFFIIYKVAYNILIVFVINFFFLNLVLHIVMVLIITLLVSSLVGCYKSLDIEESDQFDLVQNLDVLRTKRDDRRILDKFPDTEALVCDMLHVTDEAPFTAIILYKTSGRLLCLGSIIDDKHVLSAKRCYEKSDVSDLLVLVGYYKAYWGRWSQVLPVTKIVRHEYEVALLRLGRSVKYTEYVRPVRLPTSITKLENFDKIFPPPYRVVGFNVDRYDVPGDLVDRDKVYEVRQDTVSPFDECRKNYTKLILEPTKLFCTVGNATFCWGSWGAPVIKTMQKTDLLQVGVVVADNCTGDTTGPLLAARTDAYGDWIRGNAFRGFQT